MNINSGDAIIGILLILVAAILAILLIVGFVTKINAFTRELDYINLEIGRTTGRERKYWKRAKRRLWLSLLFPLQFWR